MGDKARWRVEAACNLLDIVDDVGDRHLHEQVIVDRCRTAATTPVEGVNLVAGGGVDSGMFLPAPRGVATTVHADQRRPLRRVFRRGGESFDANAVDVILAVIDRGHSRNGDGDFLLGCHVRSFSWSRVYPSEKMHQRTERGFASVAQLLSFFAAVSAAIMPTLRRY